MKDVFTPDQMADLTAINEICAELKADLVLIGAMSLLLSMGDIGRFTRDVDLTVALDLDEFALLTDRLTKAGWTRAPRLEHRWIAPRKTIIDLLPAGPKLRSAGSIEWPLSQFAMSLAGFDHVFANAVDLPFTNGAHIRVAPPIVTVLLKMIAYTEDPHRRAKDLADIRRVLGRYEADSDRLFSDAVFDAELPDFSEANAFLLGVDLRALATQDEAAYIERFLQHFLPQDEEELDADDFAEREFRARLHAFAKGFKGQ
ncbi:MAG TPA: nucleotidyl transferase AbiEii/AbiGii toxin family protein [Bryobacteraceae bacterium]|nr:nucleotidyl transferase AbiEii/AbiGii toxin family protein [Bryobacteraceae bacterium]